MLASWIVGTTSVGVAGAMDGPAETGDSVVGRVPTAASLEARPSASAVVAPPPVAVPVTVDAPSVGLSTPLVPVGKLPDGALEVPDFGTAGWYEPGVRPGQVGPAVLVGHVDSTEGPDVFFGAKDLQPGDDILIRRGDGTVARFVVEGREVIAKEQLPVERIFAGTDSPVLRLITCGGEFDRATQSYDSNVIVYARLA